MKDSGLGIMEENP